MTEEFNLSEKCYEAEERDVISKENVKEFIKRLKEGIWNEPMRIKEILSFIDKLAGEKLT